MNIGFGFELGEHQEIYTQLIIQLFADTHGVQSVVLDRLPDGHAGYSALTLLVARPFGSDGSEQNPLLIRVGPREVIAEENIATIPLLSHGSALAKFPAARR